MLRAYKTEIKPTLEQASKIKRTMGTCRFVYNLYLARNKEVYESSGEFVSGMTFSKWLNNDYRELHPENKWIQDVSSKAVKKSIMNAETAFKKFFKGSSSFPRFKKRKNSVGCYFPKNNSTDWIVERHRVKIPTLGFVRLKEKGYIPTKAIVKSGTVTCIAGRYYVSVLAEESPASNSHSYAKGIGIDLGVKDFAIVSNGKSYKNINKSETVRRTERKLKREQKRLSRKYENKKRGDKSATYSANIAKQVKEIQAIHQRLSNIRKDYVNKVVNEVVKTKPLYITIEDLNVRGMMRNRHLAKAVSQQNFFSFRTKLTNKCSLNGIELRVVDRFFPSSKTCSHCRTIKKDLNLSDRTYKCEKCGLEMDRDFNASLNLANAKVYEVA